MLKLKRVEIHGFKSFFDRTEMKFNGAGIAAVVGPNGCGKSNLSDAISWVLGEQSAKTLRGSRMEDVIFSGTRERKPLGMAAVTMTLVDPEQHIEHAAATAPHTNGHAATGNGHNRYLNGKADSPESRAGEITITRRLFRSGESEYLINGRMARLRDIQDLFTGTGLGPESYAIIEQGRIGQILSNRPQDRRSVIEEAAGITKFKTKRRLAEAKLEGAKQNLTRVFDILEEVSRQVTSLKRQAAKARRYDELKTEMISQLRRALTGRFRMLERLAAKTALDLNRATAEVQALSTNVHEREREQAQIQEQSYQTEGELTEGRKHLAELRLDAERTRGRLEYQAKQIGAIDERLTQGENESQDLERRLDQHRQDLDLHMQALAELEQQTESARLRLTAKNDEREKLQGALIERERALESARHQVLRLLGEASSLKNQLTQVDEYLSAIERDRGRAQKEEQLSTAELDRFKLVKKDLSDKMAARQLELTSLADQRREVESGLAVRKEKAMEARRQLDSLRSDASRVKARKDSLEEILSHRAYTTEAVKRLFTAIEKGQAEDLHPSGVLADFFEVEPAYEKAAEEFLHEELEYVVVSDWNQAERGVDLMRSNVDGRVTFLVESAEPNSTNRPAQAESPEGTIGRLADFVRMTNGLTGTSFDLLPRLANCYLTTDRAAAQNLARAYPQLYFLLPDGVSYRGGAVSGGKKTGSGPLALKRELREVTSLVGERQKQVEQTAALLEGLDREIALYSEDLERVRALQQNQEKDALALDHENRKLAEEHARASSRLSVARLELDRLRHENDRSTEQRDRNRQLVFEKEDARHEQESAMEAIRQQLSSLQGETARVAEEHSALRVDLAEFEERRRSERTAQNRLENQMREFANRREEIGREMERLGVERARLLSDNIELDARAGHLAEAMSTSEALVSKLAARETGLRAILSAADEALKLLRLRVQAAHEQRSKIELELVKLQAELKYLDETSRKELDMSLEQLSSLDETVLDEDSLREAEQKYQEFKAKIDALGPVNSQALEEYQEAQQRYDFLNTQRQDLLDSIRDTEKAIHEIDTESRKRFTEAFDAINAHFREMFQTLFAGGTGEMRLTDDQNLADSGIDIVASPPGKKLQSVLLLSGGEKSLTAMALLMAIFRYSPSPFCVLDEVDAPLDEPNIERLTRLLKEMSKQTQFIVITHAKRTMEAAQALYGVTMQEPGVSKVVSVKFQPFTEHGDRPAEHMVARRVEAMEPSPVLSS